MSTVGNLWEATPVESGAEGATEWIVTGEDMMALLKSYEFTEYRDDRIIR
jgi:hypothetical protein